MASPPGGNAQVGREFYYAYNVYRHLAFTGHPYPVRMCFNNLAQNSCGAVGGGSLRWPG